MAVAVRSDRNANVRVEDLDSIVADLSAFGDASKRGLGVIEDEAIENACIHERSQYMLLTTIGGSEDGWRNKFQAERKGM